MRFLKTLILCLLATAVAYSAPVWFNDLDEAKVQGLKEGKPVLVVFLNEKWSPASRSYREGVLSSSEFAKFSENYLLVAIDCTPGVTLGAEREAKNNKCADKMRVSVYPTTMLLDPMDDGVFGLFPGAPHGLTAEQYVGYLARPKNNVEGKKIYEQMLARSAALKATPEGDKIEAEAKIDDVYRWNDKMGFTKRAFQAARNKDFKTAEMEVEKMFEGITGQAKAMLYVLKADLLIQAEPTAKKQGLELCAAATALAGSNDLILRTIERRRAEFVKK
jgi:uncharacterized protein YdbL (DUF1318 family)